MALDKETLGFWEKLLKLVEKYGYWRMTKLVMFVVFTITMLYLGKNFGENYTFDEQKQKAVVSQVMAEKDQQREQLHSVEMTMRNNIKPLVSQLLRDAINQMNADRAFVIELHNGSNNTAGLPFIHASMTYEVVARNIEPIDEDYQNISLTRFVFSEYLHQHDLWFGPIDEFLKLDPKMGKRLKNNGATYLVITTIRSETCEIGYFGFLYYDDAQHEVSKKEQMEFIVHAVQKLSKLLDKDSTT
jgi:hypothetical protein